MDKNEMVKTKNKITKQNPNSGGYIPTTVVIPAMIGQMTPISPPALAPPTVLQHHI